MYNHKACLRPGFSLIELSLVLLIITLLALLTGAHVRLFDRLMVRAELERLHSVCSYLQRSAMITHKPVQLKIDPARNTYCYRKSEYRLPPQVIFGCAAGVHGPPSAPTASIIDPVTFKDHTITFHPDGIISSGAIYVTNKTKQYTYALSSSVAQVSYLRKYQYTDSWVLL